MKWGCLLLALASLVDVTAFAQGPFQFREAYFLERRVARSGEDYNVSHASVVGRTGPSQASQFIPDASKLQVYQTLRWLDLLGETDQFRRSGNLQLAEGQYHDMLNKLRQAQGPTSNDAIWMQDHLGDFYLEVRDFDRAYQNFSEALSTERQALASLANPQATMEGRVHMMSLLTKLGRLDFAKGDLAHSATELTEADCSSGLSDTSDRGYSNKSYDAVGSCARRNGTLWVAKCRISGLPMDSINSSRARFPVRTRSLETCKALATSAASWAAPGRGTNCGCVAGAGVDVEPGQLRLKSGLATMSGGVIVTGSYPTRCKSSQEPR